MPDISASYMAYGTNCIRQMAASVSYAKYQGDTEVTCGGDMHTRQRGQSHASMHTRQRGQSHASMHTRQRGQSHASMHTRQRGQSHASQATRSPSPRDIPANQVRATRAQAMHVWLAPAGSFETTRLSASEVTYPLKRSMCAREML
jgi:hypothetical protein